MSLSGFCGINRRQRRQDRGIWLHHDVDVCRCVDRTTLDPVKMDISFILFEGIPAAEVLWVLTVSRKPRRSLVAENLDHFCFAARPPRTHPPSSFYFSRFAFSVFVAVLVFELCTVTYVKFFHWGCALEDLGRPCVSNCHCQSDTIRFATALPPSDR